MSWLASIGDALLEFGLRALGITAFISAVFAFIFFTFYRSFRDDQAKRSANKAWAASRGWWYTHGKNPPVTKGFSFLKGVDQPWALIPSENEPVSNGSGFFSWLSQQSGVYAAQVFQGTWNTRTFIAFSYRYETGGKNGEVRWLNIVATRITTDNLFFPELTIRPEGSGSRLANLVTNTDIDFDSVEFSRTFDVRSKHKQFAYEVCNSQMIEYLLQHPTLRIEIEGHWIAETRFGEMELDTIEPRLENLSRIIELMPPHIFSY